MGLPEGAWLRGVDDYIEQLIFINRCAVWRFVRTVCVLRFEI